MTANEVLNPRNVLTQPEREELRKKIEAIEGAAHSRIAVHVIGAHKGSLYDRAVKEFSRHKLFHRELKTGVLLLISLKSRQFQLLGDEHIHDKMGEEGWNRMAAALSESFKDGKFFEGISRMLDDLGEQLKRHFQKTGDAQGQADRGKI